MSEGGVIRVVLFGGGPRLEQGVVRFLVLLEQHPEVELRGAWCQSSGQSVYHVLGDLWRRRRFLAVPLAAIWAGSTVSRFVRHPLREMRTRRAMRDLESRVHFVPDIHAPDVLTAVQETRADLGLIYGSPILRPELFEIPRLGTLGIHHGTMPQYRGKKTTFWEMYNDEESAGVTIQQVNRGLDTGAIVEQGQVPVGSRSRARVWAEVEDLGLRLYLSAILKARDGTLEARAGSAEKGTLYRDPPATLVLKLWWRQLTRRVMLR